MNKKPFRVLNDFDYRILHARIRDLKVFQDLNDMLDSNLSLIFYGSHERIFCKSIINQGGSYCSPIGKVIDKDDNNSKIDLKIEIDGKINLKSIYIQSFLRDKNPRISNRLTDKIYDLSLRINKNE